MHHSMQYAYSYCINSSNIARLLLTYKCNIFFTAYAYGLYQYVTNGKLYAIYLSNNGPFALIQIETPSFSNSTLAEDMDSHNLKELSSSQHLYTEHNNSVYIVIGEDIVELILNGETPQLNRILVGHPPTEIYVNTSGSRTYLTVHYEENSHSFCSNISNEVQEQYQSLEDGKERKNK